MIVLASTSVPVLQAPGCMADMEKLCYGSSLCSSRTSLLTDYALQDQISRAPSVLAIVPFVGLIMLGMMAWINDTVWGNIIGRVDWDGMNLRAGVFGLGVGDEGGGGYRVVGDGRGGITR